MRKFILFSSIVIGLLVTFSLPSCQKLNARPIPRARLTDCVALGTDPVAMEQFYEANLLIQGFIVDDIQFFDGPSMYAPHCFTIYYHGYESVTEK